MDTNGSSCLCSGPGSVPFHLLLSHNNPYKSWHTLALWPKCMLVCHNMMIPIIANNLLRPHDYYLQSEPLTGMMKIWCNLFGSDCKHLP